MERQFRFITWETDPRIEAPDPTRRSNVLAPTLITVLCIEWGPPGWVVMAGLILGAAALIRPACAWALRTRKRYGALTATG